MAGPDLGAKTLSLLSPLLHWVYKAMLVESE